MASIFDNLGQGLQNAGAVLSPDVANRQAIERQQVLPNMLRGLQIATAKRAYDADTEFSKSIAGMQPSSFKNSDDVLSAISKVPLSVIADSPQAQNTLRLAGQMQQREALAMQRKQNLDLAREKIDVERARLDAYLHRDQGPRVSISPDKYTPDSLKKYSQSKDIGDLVPVKSTQEGQPVDKYGPVTNLEVKDATGKVSNIMAQQDKRSGAWVSADEKRSPIDVSNGFKPVKDTALGSREATLLQRGIVSAADAVSDITNMSLLPVKATTGIFGMGHEVVSPSIYEAPKRALLNKMTSQDAQSMQVAIKGVGRALAGLATGGVYVNQAIIRQYDMLAPQPGDTYLTKLQKLATMRQNADNGIDSILTNPRIGEDQKKMLEQLKDALKQAVPYAPAQVINYMKQGRDDETFDQYYARTAGKGQPKKSGDLPPGFVEDKADRIPQ